MYQPRSSFEIVRSNSSYASLSWNGSTAILDDLPEGIKRIFCSLDPALLANINVPAPTLDSCDVSDLHEQLCLIASEFCTANRSQIEILAFGILVSWLPELSPVPLVMCITGPTYADVIAIGRVLPVLCRNSILTGEARRIGFPSVLTTILDGTTCSETELKAFGNNTFISFNHNTFVHNGPTFILGRDIQNELAINVRVGRCCSHIPCEAELEEIKAKFIPKLLHHRLAMLNTKRTPRRYAPELNFSAALKIEVLRSGTDFVGHQQKISALVTKANTEWLEDALLSVPGAILECCFIAAHDVQQASCGYIAERAELLLCQRFERATIKARRVGSEFRRFGLETHVIEGGRGLRFDPDVVRKIHIEAFSLDLPSTRIPKTGCAFCAEFAAPSAGQEPC